VNLLPKICAGKPRVERIIFHPAGEQSGSRLAKIKH
jgi:hypothetical protein